MSEHDMDERLRDAFAARAARTTVTERSWAERIAISEAKDERRVRVRPLLAAAALVAIVVGGVAFAFRTAADNPHVVIVTNPTTVTTRPELVTHENPRVAPPTTMQLGAATDYYRPDSPIANFPATIDAARTSIACERWRVTGGEVVCDALVGRVVVRSGDAVTVHTLYGVDTTDSGYTVSTPINDAALYHVGGRPALVSDDGAGNVDVAFEIDAHTRVVVEGRGMTDEVVQWAESVRPTPLDLPTVPLVAVAHQPGSEYPVGRAPTAWTAVGVDDDGHPCVAIVPSPSGCRTLDDAAIGGIADNMLVVGWARPDVTRVEVRNDDSVGVDAAFVDTIDLGDTRVFYADTMVDRFVRITAFGYDAAGTKLATVVVQEPCTTCE